MTTTVSQAGETLAVLAREGHLAPRDRERLRAILLAGGVVVFPTDTVYGIGCNAFNPAAVARVYALKGRTYHKPLPILLVDASQLPLVAENVPPEAARLTKAFWPGPLTMVFNTARRALHATRGKNTVAVRVPDHGVVRELLLEIGVPLAATSANRSGAPAVKTAREAKRAFFGRVEALIDGGRCRIGRESSVVDATHYPFTVLRTGALSKERLRQALAP